MTKRLCVAEFSGSFCFVTDAPDDKLNEEASAHLSEFEQFDSKYNVDVDDVRSIDDSSEIPSDMFYTVPLGSKDKKDCSEFFENLDEAKRITERLEKLDYDLEESFVEDLQHILNTELGEEDEPAE